MVLEYAAPPRQIREIPQDRSALGTLTVATETDLESLHLHADNGQWKAVIKDEVRHVQLSSINFSYIALYSLNDRLHGVILPTGYVQPRLEQQQALHRVWPSGERRGVGR